MTVHTHYVDGALRWYSDDARPRRIVFNRRVRSALQWGDLGQLVSEASLEFVPLGACHGRPSEEFYGDRGANDLIDRARAVCAGCGVVPECLAWALAHEKVGVWGGTSERQRRGIRKQLGIRLSMPQSDVGGALAKQMKAS